MHFTNYSTMEGAHGDRVKMRCKHVLAERIRQRLTNGSLPIASVAAFYHQASAD